MTLMLWLREQKIFSQCGGWPLDGVTARLYWGVFKQFDKWQRAYMSAISDGRDFPYPTIHP